MQATVETISNLERRLTVAMPAQPIEEEIGKRLNTMARTAKMAGFRPGKVPKSIVVQQYGDQIRQEVMSAKVEETFGQAVMQHKLRVAGYPSIAPKPVEGIPESYEYVATFEVMPEVKIGDLSGMKIEQPKVKLTEADVNKTVDVLRNQRATYEPVTRAAKVGDRVSIELSSSIEGQKVEDTGGQTLDLTLGEGGRLPEFDDNIVGIKAGKNKQFDLTFPADYHNADLTGKTASYNVTVVSVMAPKLAEVDADFAKELGVADGNVEKMRADIQESLEQEISKRVKAVVKEQVMDGLVATVDLELPRSLIAMECNNQMQTTTQNMQQRGVPLEQINLNPGMFEETAKRVVKLRMMMMEIVRSNSLQATPEQVRAQIDEFAKNFEQPAEVLTWYYADPKRLDEPSAMATEENVVNWVLSQAKVTDKKTSFDDLMGKGQA
ncbi:MAG TPA: trigger factor [Methylophilaceae bacterium]|jgi:trigger factor